MPSGIERKKLTDPNNFAMVALFSPAISGRSKAESTPLCLSLKQPCMARSEKMSHRLVEQFSDATSEEDALHELRSPSHGL